MWVDLFNQLIGLILLIGLSLLAIGLGRVVLARSKLKFEAALEINLFAFALGGAILGYSIFILGVLQLLYPTIIYILLGIYAVIAIADCWKRPLFFKQHRCNIDLTAKQVSTPLSFQDRCFGAILLGALCSGYLLVLTPAISNDALTYHLAVPKLFLQHHGIYFIEGNLFAQYPLYGEMLFLIGLVLQGDVLAKGVHFAFALGLLASMYQFYRLQFPRHTFIFLAPLLFFTIPSVFINSHTAYTDMIMAFYTFLAVWACLNWLQRQQDAWIAVCGVLTGLAMASKYAGLLMPSIGCLGILWGGRHQGLTLRPVIRLLCIYVVCAFLIGCPFYLKNWILTGNPLYPFFFKIFGGKGWSVEQAHFLDVFHHQLGMGRELKDYLLLPWNLSVKAAMNSPRFDGVLGPIFLLTLPLAMGLRKTPQAIKIMAIYCIIMFIFWASSVQQIRYLIPICPFLAIIVGYLLNFYRPKAVLFTWLILAVSFSLTFNAIHISNHFQKIKPLGIAIGGESRNAFLDRMIPSHTMFRYVNQNLPPESKLFFIYMKNLGYLCDRAYYSDSMFESYTIQKILSRAASPVDVVRALKSMGCTHILYDIQYVFGKLSTFTDKEKERFKAFQKHYLKLIKSTRQRFYLYRIGSDETYQ